MLRDLMYSGGRFCTFLLLSCLSFASLGAEEDDKNLPYDVRIIIDISGSMKQTDPNNLRIPALNLLLELMPEGAQAGIWTFGQFVNNLVPVAQVDDAWRQKAKQAGVQISSLGLLTNLTGALDDAAWGLKSDSGYQQSIILLTDGKVDMASASNEADEVNRLQRQRLMTQVLDKYRAAGANIHTLALSDLADKNLLQEIAMETDGLYSEASNAEELMKAFLRAFDRAVPAEQVPMEDNTFVIDDSVDEFTALIFKRSDGGQETALLTPGGERFTELEHSDSVRWHKDISFDLVTVKQPEAGTWIAEADLDPDNRVTILSDLALSVEGIPATIFPGDKLDVEIKLTNEGETVSKAEILRLTDMTMRVVTATGREGSKVLSDPESPPADGIYREGLYRLKELGQYQLAITAEGRTFQRQRSFSMTMIQPVEINHQPDEEKLVYRIEVKALSDNLDVERSRVIAKIKSPDENTIIQSVVFDQEARAWIAEVSDTKGPGQYSVDLNIRGITQSGKNFKVKPESIVFDLPIKKAKPEQPIEEANSQTEAGEEETVPKETDPQDIQQVNPEVASDDAGIAPKISMADVTQVEAIDEIEAGESRLAEEGMEADQLDAELVEDDGLAWWIYLILVLLNVAVIGAGVWWFLLRKNPAPVDAQTSMETDSAMAELEELEDDFAGDFDSLDEGEEEDIPAVPGGEVKNSTGQLEEDALPEAADSFDEDFSIDPDDDVDTDEDSWGEFDADKKD